MNDRESKMITLRTDESGKPTVWCDPEIADLVDALNTGDLSTVASCSGHGHRPGRISLKDGRELLVMNSEQADAAERLFGTDINGDFTNAGAQEAVAYGLPNTAITGKKQALMQVRLDIPSNDQYGGALWVPLYLANPALQSQSNTPQDGWKLVPVEPTEEMIKEGDEVAGSLSVTGDYSAEETYSRMLAAALTPPQQEQSGEAADISGWWAALEEAAACLEIASYSISDPDAKRAAIGACEYARKRARELNSSKRTSDQAGAAVEAFRLAVIEVCQPRNPEQDEDYEAGYVAGMQWCQKQIRALPGGAKALEDVCIGVAYRVMTLASQKTFNGSLGKWGRDKERCESDLRAIIQSVIRKG